MLFDDNITMFIYNLFYGRKKQAWTHYGGSSSPVFTITLAAMNSLRSLHFKA